MRKFITLAMLISFISILTTLNAQTDTVSVDRFSEDAGHLFVRSDENGLPGPNEPINFDMEPFFSKGLGPDGELIGYYNFDVMPTEPAPIYVLFREGEMTPVEGQMNIIDVIPGDTLYNDFWEVHKVTVPSDYTANTVTSYGQISIANYPVEETTILVNCPVVPFGSTAKLRGGGESPELTTGWYKGMVVFYFNFTEKALMTDDMDMVPLSPIYVSFNINPGEEGGGPPSGFMTDPVTGRTHNVTATLPEDDDYSPLWMVNMYDNADFWDVYDLESAMGATILVEGAANVNCPVVAGYAGIDRFSEEAGHLFVRNDENGLPGPNEPVDFDMAPFITEGFGPLGEWISYYNFDVMPTDPAPIYVLFREGETSPVEGQMNIIDVIPGDTMYNDFWNVTKVTVPADYVANTVTSYAQIMLANYPMEETTILVNCPVVPEGSSAALRYGDGGTGLTMGWYKGMIVYYFNFVESALMTDEMGMVPLSPIYVTFNINPGEEGGGPPSGFMTDTITGRTHNVTATLPEDENYSPLWMVNILDNADFWSVYDLASAWDATLLVEGAANVNCPVVKVDDVTAVEDPISDQSAIRLEQNFPNPFSNSTQIRFTVDQVENISLRVFNISGKQIAELMNRQLTAGEYAVRWDASDQAEGIYFYSLQAGNYVETKKMVILK